MTVARTGLVTVILSVAALAVGFSRGGSGRQMPAQDAATEAPSDALTRGEYIFRAAGGCTCHSTPGGDRLVLAGGRPIKTPFGIMYGTNITPDPETGIGSWSEQDFIKAMREGIGPDGKVYYPVFPYTSFTRMTDEDVTDLRSFLMTLDPVSRPNPEHELGFPYNLRTAISAWRALNFDQGRFQPDETKSDEWNRGAYLAEAVAHCGECHTPRKFMGAVDQDLFYAGSAEGPEGELAPNITPHEATGIGSWSVPDIVWFMQTAFKPDGDDSQGLMGEVINEGYQHLDEEDLKAIATFLKGVEPIENEVKAKE